MLTQDVKGMPYALCLIELGTISDESTMIEIQI